MSHSLGEVARDASLLCGKNEVLNGLLENLHDTKTGTFCDRPGCA